MNKILTRDFYQRDTVQVAKDLLGKILVHNLYNKKLVGIINETEAYKSDDPACHAFTGKTERNKTLFGPIGHAYVYISYGMHYCLNFVAHDKNFCVSGGVLIRSVIPVQGIDYMLSNRNLDIKHIKNLTNGPGKLTQAFSINKSHDGIDITNPKMPITVLSGINLDKKDIVATKRIGITKNQEALWRFLISPDKVQKIDFKI